ncbi:MAG: phospholipase D-like domain-containing protein [Verrucomicrobiota bacterium]
MPTKIKIAVYANCDDVLIAWRIDKAIKSCWGFALEREMKDATGTTSGFVTNRTGFRSRPGKPGEQRPSNEWPFQRFSWTDHKVNTGDTVRYRVSAVMTDQDGGVELDATQRSDWTPWLTLTGQIDKTLEVYFNRGTVMSQFAGRYLQKFQQEIGEPDFDKALRAFKNRLAQHDAPIRLFLGGELRRKVIDVLDSAKKKGQHVFAALYELEDEELIQHLSALKGKAHVVLANGSVKTKGGDQNAAGRKKLKQAGVDVVDRMVCTGAGGPLGHNKFLVVCNSAKKALSAWTGSLNWTKTGLCTQINNGILIHHAPIADEYLQQYHRLAGAGNAFPKPLVAANSKPKSISVAGKRWDVWFTRASSKVDLAALDAEVEGAKDAILFLMFMPGPTATLKTIRDMARKHPKLYVHGVATQLPKDDQKTADVETLGTSGVHRAHLKIVQTEGIKNPFAAWTAEVTRNEFKGNIGNAIIHSKLVVIDPFTNPVVITGSHNFSNSASGKNDENFVIIRGHRALAEAYAAHIIAMYHHYRWRAHVAAKQAANKQAWGGLEESDGWQMGHLKGASLREIEFWCP